MNSKGSRRLGLERKTTLTIAWPRARSITFGVWNNCCCTPSDDRGILSGVRLPSPKTSGATKKPPAISAGDRKCTRSTTSHGIPPIPELWNYPACVWGSTAFSKSHIGCNPRLIEIAF